MAARVLGPVHRSVRLVQLLGAGTRNMSSKRHEESKPLVVITTHRVHPADRTIGGPVTFGRAVRAPKSSYHSHLVFSQWDKIFKDPMTTAAAIDRVVHHATILELPGPSIREDEALKRLRSPDTEVPA